MYLLSMLCGKFLHSTWPGWAAPAASGRKPLAIDLVIHGQGVVRQPAARRGDPLAFFAPGGITFSFRVSHRMSRPR